MNLSKMCKKSKFFLFFIREINVFWVDYPDCFKKFLKVGLFEKEICEGIIDFSKNLYNNGEIRKVR